jgi:hypothetical protein
LAITWPAPCLFFSGKFLFCDKFVPIQHNTSLQTTMDRYPPKAVPVGLRVERYYPEGASGS